MSDNLPASLWKLRDSAAQLNQLTDQANNTVKEVENFLNRECSVGVQASVRVQESPLVDQEGEPVGTSVQFLEYRRVGGTYRIAVVWGTDLDPGDERVKAWSDCPRDEKLETIEKLPELIEAIAAALDEKVETARRATQSVSTLLKALRGKEGA